MMTTSRKVKTMSNSTALDVMRLALQQYHTVEKPAGSNNVKYNTWYYGHPVHGSQYAWCATFVSYVGEMADGDNPIAKSSNAADIQDLTVQNKGGKYILKQTANNTKKKEALPNYRFGDSISFNFNGKSTRQHTGFIIGVVGNTIFTCEGNTSFTEKGSQSNGGCVANRDRSYTTGVCVVRPKYAPHKWHVPTKPFTGSLPKLPKRGYFKYKDEGERVKKLQKALAWANGYDLKADGIFGSKTFAEVVIFQVANKLTPDGLFGASSLKAMEKLVAKHREKTNAEKIVEEAKRCAWAYGTPKDTYAYPDGKPKEAYKEDLNEAYPMSERKKWGKQPRAGASCDVFVGTVMRASGVDPNFPRGLDEVEPHMAKNKDKYKVINNPTQEEMLPGDIIYELYKGGGGHISIFLKAHRIAQAQYNGKTYPHVQKYEKQIKDSHKKFCVYRTKEK